MTLSDKHLSVRESGGKWIIHEDVEDRARG